jgi:hypothetical protein
MNTHYPKEAFEKMAKEITDSSSISEDFEFGETPFSANWQTNENKENSALKAFFCALEQRQQESLIEMVIRDGSANMVRFLNHPWETVKAFLMADAEWRSEVTKAVHQYLKDCAEGKRDDDNINSAMEKGQ